MDFIEQLKQAERVNAGDPLKIQQQQREIIWTRIRALREQYKLTCEGSLIKKSQKESK